MENSIEKGKVAVIDIGSNSLRFVIFDRYGRYPYPLFNERITCRLGEGVQKTKKLKKERIQQSLETIKRFSKIIEKAELETVLAIGTAALRLAENAKDFIVPAEKYLSNKIRILSGTEEANLVALGLTANIPKANGIIADLGGGSLELVKIENGKRIDSVSLNFGHLIDIEEKNFKKIIKKLKWKNDSENQFFYGVGGSFRALGLVFKQKNKYPLNILHGLNISSKKANRILNKIIKLDGNVKGLPQSRKPTMSNAAKIMRIVIKATDSKKIIISGTSVREGLVLENISLKKLKHDPLISTCEEIAKHSERFEGLSSSLENFLLPMISIGDEKELSRLLKASCLLADIAWNEHTSSRNIIAAEKILLLPTNSLTHRERAWLAKTLFHRYNRPIELVKFPFKFKSILSMEDKFTSLIFGLSLRFSMAACAGLPGLLNDLKLELSDDNLKVVFLGNTKTLLVDHVYEKLNLLASYLGKEMIIEI